MVNNNAVKKLGEKEGQQEILNQNQDYPSKSGAVGEYETLG